MTHTPLSAQNPSDLPRSAQIILRMLAALRSGQLHITLPNSQMHTFNAKDSGELAQLQIHDWDCFGVILRGGDIAFAELFMEGRITTPHLPTLLKLLVANRQAVEQAIYGTWWGSIIDRFLHLLRRNSKSGARKNIAAHYDLGNDFYQLWLDTSMTYSSAIFPPPYSSDAVLDETQLQSAQLAKYARVLTQLDLPSQAHILEIGCGWGGFASVATQTGAKMTGLTLSTEQWQYAQQRMASEGVSDQVLLKLQDYRDEGVQAPAQYDGIASIEMFEAVGEAYWPSYFECVARNLKAGGKACIQTIVIRDDLFARYRKGTDFIQRYIFPGGMLPSPEVFVALAHKSGLKVVDRFEHGLDYARTLAVWRLRFLRVLDQVRALGYPPRFIRMWEFYLAYCEAGFVAGDINVMQFTLCKPSGEPETEAVHSV